MIGLIITSLISLFSIINPFSALPVFVSLTNNHDASWIKKQTIKTCINVIIVCIVSFFFGKPLLGFFGISIYSLKVAGGFVICISGFLLMRTKKNRKISKRLKKETEIKQDISFTPLTMPLLAGPGCISFLITQAVEYTGVQNIIAIIVSIFLIAFFIYFLFSSAPSIIKIIGNSGLIALSRVMGFLVLAIGVEMILRSLTEYIVLNIKL